MSGRLPLPQRLALGLAALFLAHGLFSTTFWSQTAAAFQLASADYPAARNAIAFKGFPLDELASRLDRLLPRDQPVALGPPLGTDDFLRQRFTEGLYPRRIDPKARHSVAVSSGPDGLVLLAQGELGSPAELRLFGAPIPSKPVTPAGLDYSISWPAFLFCILGALGLGAALLEMWSFPLEPALQLAAAFAAGSLVVGVAASVESWLQLALPRFFLPLAGVVAGSAVAARHRATQLTRFGSDLVRRPENLVIVALCLLVFFRLAFMPIGLWDGRSIWLFHARQLFHHGYLPRADLIYGETLWSHPDYPLLLPGWLSYFGGFDAYFNERQAALGLATMLSALIVLFWILARERLGRWPGALLTLVLVLATDTLNFGAYADGYLALFLLTATLAFVTGCEPLSWLLFAAASLLKAEGLVLALSIALPLLVFERGARLRSPRQLRGLVVFVPALAHKAWVRLEGIDSVLKGNSLSDALAAFLPRLADLLAAAPGLLVSQGYTHARTLLVDAPLAVAALIVLRLALRSRLPRAALALLVSAFLAGAFAFVSISLLPESVDWFVSTALDRLLLHVAALLVLVPLIHLADFGESRDEAN